LKTLKKERKRHTQGEREIRQKVIEIKKRKIILNAHNKELQARSSRDSQSGKKMIIKCKERNIKKERIY